MLKNQSNSRHQNAAYQEKAEEREVWYKLVVKIICWKEGLFAEKISDTEWGTYCERIVEINATHGKDKTIESLKEAKRIIQKRGGFVNPNP